MPQQPVNALAPFEVGNGAFSVDQFGNVIAPSVTFADGSVMESAGGGGVTIAAVLSYIRTYGLYSGTSVDMGTY